VSDIRFTVVATQLNEVFSGFVKFVCRADLGRGFQLTSVQIVEKDTDQVLGCHIIGEIGFALL